MYSSVPEIAPRPPKRTLRTMSLSVEEADRVRSPSGRYTATATRAVAAGTGTSYHNSTVI